jgi:hypothetical protein
MAPTLEAMIRGASTQEHVLKAAKLSGAARQNSEGAGPLTGNVSRARASLSKNRWPVLIFAAAFTIRMALIVHNQSIGPLGHTEAFNVARSIVERGTFGNPYETADTGETAHVAPLFPFVLSLLMRLLGTGGALGAAVQTMTVAAASALYALFPALAETLFGDRRIGIWSGFAAAALPFHLWLESVGTHEGVYAGLAIAILFLCTSRWLRRGIPKFSDCVRFGIGWGVAALVSPTVLPVMAALLILWLGRGDLRSAFLHAAVAGLCCGLVILPWIIRNYFVLGSASIIRDNFGLELSVSNNDDASPLMADNYRLHTFHHPFVDPVEAREMKTMGETAYYKMRLVSAKLWISKNPSRFWSLTLVRIREFWFTDMNSRVKSVFYGVLVVLAFVGLVILGLSGRRDALLLAVLWAVYPIPFYLIQIDPRYRVPIDWSIWLLAAFALSSIAGYMLNHKRPTIDDGQHKPEG